MFKHVHQFVSQFRELEKKEIHHTQEEEQRLKVLKEKLTKLEPDETPKQIHQRCIAVVSLYPQAGASFLAGNTAFAMAGNGHTVSLCELPGRVSHTYFALDIAQRAPVFSQQRTASTSILFLQNNNLRIHVETPLSQTKFTQNHTDWLFRMSRESAVVLIDFSSDWRDQQIEHLLGFVDEIWVVIDTDIARLTRMMVTEQPPKWWLEQQNKIRIIANKWSERWNRSAVMKKVDGTLSLWDEGNPVRVEKIVPLIDGEKTFEAHSKAKLLLEEYPEEESGFASLLS
ncbi:hypothetical protein NDK47_01085 [Brevibacillus ruminantium]|uniref:Uncharacterized protein n=1 Tax=Brevibacillus ruminantium TaxID=2950604 RepID=A0ABY4WFR2_9BACL|nr:hypothetical protein [Brevibacillus ruminantium]USG65982.1 hypothetical protein NDK47_01085 [Brevibacillus ruminantium]